MLVSCHWWSGFSGGSVVKNLPADLGDTGDMGSITGLGRSPGGGHGSPLQDSCLENPMDRGAWRSPVHGVSELTWPSDWACARTHADDHLGQRAVCVLREWDMGGGAHTGGIIKWSVKWRSAVSESLWPHALYSPWDSPGGNTGVGSLSLLQGTFPTQGSNLGLPRSRRILYQLSHKGSPNEAWWYVITDGN